MKEKKFTRKMTISHKVALRNIVKGSSIALALFTISANAVEHEQLNEYILFGIDHNHALQRDIADRDIATYSQKGMVGNFLPNVTLHSRHTASRGGRTVDLPLGDLLNPVYDNLNDLNGGTRSYPQIENEEIAMLPEKDHETKIRIIQPLFNMDIISGYRASKFYSESENANYNSAVNQLSGEIRVAYFNVLKAKKGSDIFNSSLIRAEENLRVAEKLFAVGSVTQTAVLASRTSLLKVEQQVDSAERMQRQAAEYFNMILNRPLDTQVNFLPSDTLINGYQFVLEYENMNDDELGQLALNNRFETKNLMLLKETLKQKENLERGKYFPSLSGVLDAGFQGDNSEFSDETDMISASLLFEWNLFNGAQRRNNIAKAKLETSKIEVSIDELSSAIQFETEKAKDDLTVARSSYSLAVKRAETAELYLNEVKNMYLNGAESYNNFIQAENDFTQADLNQNITEYEILIAASNLITALGINDYYLPQMEN